MLANVGSFTPTACRSTELQQRLASLVRKGRRGGARGERSFTVARTPRAVKSPNSLELPCAISGPDGPIAAMSLPDFLTITEAARTLRIGRTAAYEQAT